MATNAASNESSNQIEQQLAELLAELGEALPNLSSSAADRETLPTPPDGTLGDFRIERQIGRGGMGIVYRARQISLERCVALKVLPFATVLDPTQLQ
jgi:serine/threonine protein kinase